MKQVFALVLFVLSTFTVFASGEIVLKGVYQGKNIYVMNPFASSGVGFCVFEVTVNGQLTTDEINSSAFEVDLTVFQFKKGDKLVISIKHKDGCLPKVINPEVLKPQSTYKASLAKIDRNGMLTWTSTNESGSLPFIIEQFRWNKWVKVGEVEGKGTAQANKYSCQVHPHSGNNRFRLKQIDYTRKPRYSSEIRIRSMLPPVTFEPLRPTTEIVFSRETMFEIYDYFGNLKMKGLAARVNISKLGKGDYFLNYGTKTETFKKK
ncbi:MAG: hypothetical protein PF517_20070 [Salinivirgaceae bacterium]|jgi:hypothetical protein|nr:hypothetical protein [Salinivirgaceae bacterium]